MQFRFLFYSVLTSLIFQQLLVSSIQAQTPWYFNFKTDSAKNIELISQVRESKNQVLTTYSKSDQILAKELYDARNKEVVDQFESMAVITDFALQEYLMKIVSALTRSNQALAAQNMRIFFSRSFIPNAVSYGDGTILFHIGLFRQLHNEAEAAFILGHEIGHYVLGHSDLKIRKYISKVNSDSVQQLLAKLKKQEYKSGYQLDQLERETMLGLSHHSREFEKQADSFAVALLLKSGYDVNAAGTCLAMLDSVDVDGYSGDLPLKNLLGFTEYPFRSKWLQKEESIFAQSDITKNEISDSLKTHPDCDQRIRMVTPMMSGQIAGKLFLIDSQYFRSVQKTMEMEAAGFAFSSGNLSRALYYGLHLSVKYPSESFPYLLNGQCMNALYIAMKNHQMRLFSEMPGLQAESGYDDFMHFLDKLRIQDMAALSYYYHLRYQDKGKTTDGYAESMVHSSENFHGLNLKAP